MLWRFFRSTPPLLRDFYKILGVDRSAESAEIKDAYFRLAKQHHPDVSKESNAGQQFSDINDAYDTLGDSQKRNEYDMGMGKESGFRQYYQKRQRQTYTEPEFSDSADTDFSDEEFEEFFSDFAFDPFQVKPKRGRRGADIVINLELEFMESIKGVQRTVNFKRNKIWQTWNGTKSKPNAKSVRCSACQGRGMQFTAGGFGIKNWTKCNGTGMVKKTNCGTCRGQGVIPSKASESIRIPPGVGDGQYLRVQGKGHAGSRGNAGNLSIKLSVKSHPVFKRSGLDIHSKVPISITDAVLGGTTNVQVLRGMSQVVVKPGTNSGNKMKLQAKGIAMEGKSGNHYIEFVVQIPNQLTDEQRELFEKLRSTKL